MCHNPDPHLPPSAAGDAPRAAAYMDLDKTVLATSTTMAMGGPLRRGGLISTSTLARGIVTQLPYLLMGADEDQTARLMEQLAAMTTGVRRSRVEEVVAEALHTAIEPAVYAEALDLVAAHHRAGQDVVIVSASMREMVEPIARLVGADRCVGTEMETRDGVYTGRVARSLLQGAKVTAIEADAAAHGIDLPRSWAYSDSVTDLPMLELVGHPVAVNPDRDLRRAATERGWPVRDFARPVALRRAWSTPDPTFWRDLTPELRLPELRVEVPRLSTRGALVAGAAGLVVVAGVAALTVARLPQRG